MGANVAANHKRSQPKGSSAKSYFAFFSVNGYRSSSHKKRVLLLHKELAGPTQSVTNFYSAASQSCVHNPQKPNTLNVPDSTPVKNTVTNFRKQANAELISEKPKLTCCPIIENTIADTTVSTRCGISSISKSILHSSNFGLTPGRSYGQVASRPACKQIFFVTVGDSSSSRKVATNEERPVMAQSRNNSEKTESDIIMPLSSKGYYRPPIHPVTIENQNKSSVSAAATVKHVKMRRTDASQPKTAAIQLSPGINSHSISRNLPEQQPSTILSSFAPKQKSQRIPHVKPASPVKRRRGQIASQATPIKLIKMNSREIVKSHAEKKRVWVGEKGKFSTERLESWYAGMGNDGKDDE